MCRMFYTWMQNNRDVAARMFMVIAAEKPDDDPSL